MGRLTTHVLDTALGRPASGLVVKLYKVVSNGALEALTTVVTNADGRAPGPILEGDPLAAGLYELHFEAGDYLRRTTPDLTEPLFLDVIPIRFGISDPDAHYHVPLLLSPFGYSTYRGS